MKETSAIRTGVDLLALDDPIKINEWIGLVRSARIELPAEFGKMDWLLAAEKCGQRARRGIDQGLEATPANFEWALACVSAYEVLEEAEPAVWSMWLGRAMMLRAYLISKVGGRTDHPLLDSEIILEWFWSTVSISVEDAKEVALRWREMRKNDDAIRQMDQPEIDRLREPLNSLHRLAPVQILVRAGALEPNERLAAWLEADPFIRKWLLLAGSSGGPGVRRHRATATPTR